MRTTAHPGLPKGKELVRQVLPFGQLKRGSVTRLGWAEFNLYSMKSTSKILLILPCFFLFANALFGQCVNTLTCTLPGTPSAGDYKGRDAVSALSNTTVS